VIDYVNEFDVLIQEVSSALGKPIDKTLYKIIDRGLPHQPKSLPGGAMGVYTFYYEGHFLKIGKAGPNSNARFLSQHYNPNSAMSNLAKSILSDKKMQSLGITEQNVGDWIKRKCRRIDVVIDAAAGIFALELIEAILHYKYSPIYEGFITQR
jgi:hypothetical protein